MFLLFASGPAVLCMTILGPCLAKSALLTFLGCTLVPRNMSGSGSAREAAVFPEQDSSGSSALCHAHTWCVGGYFSRPHQPNQDKTALTKEVT